MTVFAKDPSRFVETAIENETVLMALDTGDFFSLTGTARDIWGQIDGQRDRTGILARLAADYDAEPAVMAAELDRFLGELHSAGLIVAA